MPPELDIHGDLDLKVQDGPDEVDLSTDHFKTPATGAATETTLLDVLAALGAVTVDGEVSLSAATLAALEAITVTLSGAVALDAPTLAALETITVANPTANPETGLAKETTLGNRFAGGKDPHCDTITAAGDTETLAPTPGQGLAIYGVMAMNKDLDANPTISVRLGARELYRLPVISRFEPFWGAPDEALVINLSEAAQVELTVHYLEV